MKNKEVNLLKKKTVAKKTLKTKGATYVITEPTPLPYVSRYFRDEWEEAKNSMFIK